MNVVGRFLWQNCLQMGIICSFKTTAEGGRVLYHPDAQDDLDEEDPDDDLLI